jgi:hypothetical protein
MTSRDEMGNPFAYRTDERKRDAVILAWTYWKQEVVHKAGMQFLAGCRAGTVCPTSSETEFG